jgi:hypothetical protein
MWQSIRTKMGQCNVNFERDPVMACLALGVRFHGPYRSRGDVGNSLINSRDPLPQYDNPILLSRLVGCSRRGGEPPVGDLAKKVSALGIEVPVATELVRLGRRIAGSRPYERLALRRAQALPAERMEPPRDLPPHGLGEIVKASLEHPIKHMSEIHPGLLVAD